MTETTAQALEQPTQGPPVLNTQELESDIVEALKNVYDPEIPVNIYDLGLIYELNASPDGQVYVAMTLTAPACPVAGAMPEWVRDAVESVDGVESADVELVWEPPWNQEMMSMRAKLELNMI
ncbi:MAG: SUF system Fe-S cluster assembly protein [Candidatus Competibacteraceae bacterium]|jgi:FeS assembly SUF system protein|nr:SUF system Fe-S cluster assembly protein [Candidatus Competibacteraceae bacterium]